MPDPAAFHAQGLAALEAYYGTACPAFTWNGTDYNCQAGTAKAAKKLELGGFEPDSDLVLIVRLSLFGSGPQPVFGQHITYKPNGKTYRIESVQTPMGAPFLRLTLVDLAKGAGGR